MCVTKILPNLLVNFTEFIKTKTEDLFQFWELQLLVGLLHPEKVLLAQPVFPQHDYSPAISEKTIFHPVESVCYQPHSCLLGNLSEFLENLTPNWKYDLIILNEVKAPKQSLLQQRARLIWSTLPLETSPIFAFRETQSNREIYIYAATD